MKDFHSLFVGLIIAISLAQSAFAQTVRVTFGENGYELNLTRDFVAFSESGFSTKVRRQKCNQNLLDHFTNEFNRNQRHLADLHDTTGAVKGGIKVFSDGKTKFAFRVGSEGIYLTDVPSKFKNLWLTSERLCAR
jgi:hypothetical protein